MWMISGVLPPAPCWRQTCGHDCCYQYHRGCLRTPSHTRSTCVSLLSTDTARLSHSIAEPTTHPPIGPNHPTFTHESTLLAEGMLTHIVAHLCPTLSIHHNVTRETSLTRNRNCTSLLCKGNHAQSLLLETSHGGPLYIHT